jgi:hypothetical protein
VARFALAVALALVGGIVIDVLTRIVGDVHDPVGEPRQPLGDAGPAVEGAPAGGGALVGLSGSRYGSVLLRLARLLIAAAPG